MNLVTAACSRLDFRTLFQQELRLIPRLSVDNRLTKILVILRGSFSHGAMSNAVFLLVSAPFAVSELRV